jgi:hypothetical protein
VWRRRAPFREELPPDSQTGFCDGIAAIVETIAHYLQIRTGNTPLVIDSRIVGKEEAIRLLGFTFQDLEPGGSGSLDRSGEPCYWSPLLKGRAQSCKTTLSRDL